VLPVIENKINIAENLCYTFLYFRLRNELRECFVYLLCIVANWNCAI